MAEKREKTTTIVMFMRCIRAWALILILALAMLWPAGTIRAQVKPVARSVQLTGQIALLEGPSGSPTGFILQRAVRSWDVHIAPNAMIMARSAEAEVEGLAVGDYAVVTATKTKGVWMASRVTFDVRPVQSTQVTVAGTIVRVSANARRFAMRLDATGALRWVSISPQTRFRDGAQPLDSLTVLVRGNAVQVLMRLTPQGWVAIDVNLKSAAISPG